MAAHVRSQQLQHSWWMVHRECKSGNNVGRQFGWCRQQPQAAEAHQQMRTHGTISFQTTSLWGKASRSRDLAWTFEHNYGSFDYGNLDASFVDDIHTPKWQRWVEWAMNKNRVADHEPPALKLESAYPEYEKLGSKLMRLRPQYCYVECKGHWSYDSSISSPQPTHKWERHCSANSCGTTKWSEMMVLWREACDDTCGPMQVDRVCVEAKILRHVALGLSQSKRTRGTTPRQQPQGK